MNILGVKTTHDGTLAFISEGSLEFSIEQEKDSHPRYAALGLSGLLTGLKYLCDVPEVLAISGWDEVGDGYFGVERGSSSVVDILGRSVRCFSSSHERTLQ